jgi:hypothetical protein
VLTNRDVPSPFLRVIFQTQMLENAFKIEY